MSNKKSHYPSQSLKPQNELSITHILNLKNIIESNNIKELQIYIKDNQITSPYLDNCLSLIAQMYNKDNGNLLVMLDILLQNGANINKPIINSKPPIITEADRVSILMLAIREKDVEMVKLLLKYHPDLNMTDIKNRNAIIYAVINEGNSDSPEIISMLLKEKANINSSTKLEIENGVYETHSVFTLACFENLLNVTKLLLDNYVNTNFKVSPSGNTGLHIAAQYGYCELAKLLLSYKIVNTEIENNMKKKPIDLAKMKGGEILNVFIDYYNNLSRAQVAVNKDGSMNSSDIGENVEEEESNVQKNKSINTNNINNNDDNIKISKTNLTQLKNTLSTNIIQQNKNGFNLEIPIEFNKSPISTSDNSLGSFFGINNAPTLSFDLNDKTFELELQLNELNAQLKEKIQMISKLEGFMQDYDKDITDLTAELKRKEKDLEYRKAQEEVNTIKIQELTKQKNDLIGKLPKEKIPSESNKNLPLKEYRDLKFNQNVPEITFITKTLQKDVMDYTAFIKDKIAKKKPVVDKLIGNINLIVNEISPDFEAVLYGSYATGLCLPWSDLDIVLVNKGQTPMAVPYIINKLYYLIKTKPWVQNIKIIESPTIPIIKIMTVMDNEKMQIDISIQEEKHFGLKCVALVKSYLSEYVVLEPLILALKTILKNANLNDPYTGGLSSYGLILMVVSYIQSTIDQNNYNEDEEDLIGKTFYGFLGHYGVYFDFNNYVILTYPIKDTNNNIIDNDSPLDFGQNSHELIIVDPLNKKNNVAKSTHQFMNLKMAFMIAFMVTKEDCECGCHYGKAPHENNMISTEHCILKRMFNSVKRFSENTK